MNRKHLKTNTNLLWWSQSRFARRDPSYPECSSNPGGAIDNDLTTDINLNGITEGAIRRNLRSAIAQDNVLMIQESLSEGAVPDENTESGKITFNVLDEGGIFFGKIALLNCNDPAKLESQFSCTDGEEPHAVTEPASILGLLAVSLMGTGSLLKRKNEHS